MPLQKLMQAMQQLQQAKGARPDVMQAEPAPEAPGRQPAGLDRLNAVADGVQDEDAALNSLAELLSRQSAGDPEAEALMAAEKQKDPEGYARRMQQIMPAMPRQELSGDEEMMAQQGWKMGKPF